MKRAAYAAAMVAAFWGFIVGVVLDPFLTAAILLGAVFGFTCWAAWAVTEGFVE